MAITVKIPTPLRRLTGGKDIVQIEGQSVREVIENLEAAHPGLKTKLCDDEGNVRRFINIYANQDDIRFLDKMETQLKHGDELSIIPAIAGGCFK
ncbi:MAG: MoaD/ThiS family protein [Myxococcales bacterium]|nr:MoaD/ThiS family protein [Myxococcales bacterium]